ncbi:MAG: hypothetical protein HRT64_13505, partial [Erythrobacter sp.]|nr:hypothetical protein [Erythrobacter sp.]
IDKNVRAAAERDLSKGGWFKRVNIGPSSITSSTAVPIIGIARAAGYMPVIHTPDTFADEVRESIDGIEYGDATPGNMLIRVEGNSMSPTIPNGSLLEVNPSVMPASGDMAVVMVSGEEAPVVKYFHRKGYKIALRSVNPDGNNYLIDLKDPDAPQVRFAWKVVEARVVRPHNADIDWDAL